MEKTKTRSIMSNWKHWMNNRTITYKSRSIDACEQQHKWLGLSFKMLCFPPKLITFTLKKKYEDLERFYMDCKNYVQTSRITRIFIDTFIAQCVHMRKKRPYGRCQEVFPSVPPEQKSKCHTFTKALQIRKSLLNGFSKANNI